MINFNVNYFVKVRLTDAGREFHKKLHQDFSSKVKARTGKEFPYTPPSEDSDGYSRWQLWSLMQEFGDAIGLGLVMPFDPVIQLLNEEGGQVVDDPVMFQFRWLNPAGDKHPESMSEWQEVTPRWNATVKEKCDELLAHRYDGKPVYEVRKLYTHKEQPFAPGNEAAIREKLEKLADVCFEAGTKSAEGAKNCWATDGRAIEMIKQIINEKKEAS